MYNRKKRLFLTAVCLSLGLLTGCNVGNTKNYKQAAQDLEQGNYEAALEEYETAISEGVKPAQSYRGAGVAKLKLGNYEEAITYFNDALKCDKVGKAEACENLFCQFLVEFLHSHSDVVFDSGYVDR